MKTFVVSEKHTNKIIAIYFDGSKAEDRARSEGTWGVVERNIIGKPLPPKQVPIESFLIGDSLYVNTEFLCAYFNKSDKQVGRWKSQGMPVVTKKPKELNKTGNWFILDQVIPWVEINVNKTKSSNSKGSEEEFDIENLEKMHDIYIKGNSNAKRKLLLRLPQNVLDNFKKIEDIVEKEAKNKEYDSKYALVDKVKVGQQELARMFISFLKTSMPVLSKELENKSQDEVYHALDRHFKKEVDKLLKYVITEEEDIATFDEIIQSILDAIVYKKIEQKDLIKMIGDLKCNK